MAIGTSQAVQQTSGAGGTGGIGALVGERGSALHPYAAGPALRTGREATRNLADAAHALCELHGFHPDLVMLAAAQAQEAGLRDWLEVAGDAFAEERSMLTRIVVAAGPIPSTPGQSESEAATIAQRHALEMLGRSERAGTALGAAAALLVDWRAIRVILDLAAERFGLAPTRCLLPEAEAVLATIEAATASPGMARAAQFGGQQYLLQQHGLWDLLEAREGARRAH